jgi:hypothetical protein
VPDRELVFPEQHQPVEVLPLARKAAVANHAEKSARAHSIGQRAGVRGRGSAEMTGCERSKNAVHRTRLSMGERLL